MSDFDCILKTKKVDNVVTKLKNIANRSIQKKHFETAMSSIAAASSILYHFNQKYVDDDLENMLEDVSRMAVKIEWHGPDAFEASYSKKTILFYDAFGLDARGLAVQYLTALAKTGNRIVYVTKKSAKGSQPVIEGIIEKYHVRWVYINMNVGYMIWLKALADVVGKTRPDIAFLYTTPNDSSGVAVFNALKGKVVRYMVNLTSHAFWIGTNACDYYIEGAERCASIAYYKRKIPLEKHIEQNVYAYVDAGNDFAGLPEGLDGKKFIFSGGALYKTLGDPDNYYYKIVGHCLEKFPDICFFYIGEGDTSELEKLFGKYPGRVFYEHERTDFFEVMKRCTLYINTYPMFGGMMMRYAVYAGKIPLTLKHERDADDVLLNQEETGCVYESYEEMISDIDMLLEDENYLRRRETQAQVGVMSISQFENDIADMVNGKYKKYDYLPEYDTTKFIKEYLVRFDAEQEIVNEIAGVTNWSLFPYFPALFFKKLMWKTRIRHRGEKP